MVIWVERSLIASGSILYPTKERHSLCPEDNLDNDMASLYQSKRCPTLGPSTDSVTSLVGH